jgi:hypothetical protein
MNFDSTVVGTPYVRIERIVIDYTAAMTANVEFVEQEYVKLADGTHRAVGTPNTQRFPVAPEDMVKLAPLRDSVTGELLGSSMSYGQVFLGNLAVLRQKQLELAGQA